MKLINLFKIKLYYLFNKKTIIIFSIFFVLLLFILIFNAFGIDSEIYKEMIEKYKLNSYLYIKLITSIFSMYLFSYSLTSQNDFISIILHPLGVSKKRLISLSIIINALFIFLIDLILFIVFCYVESRFKYFYFKKEYLISFINIYLVSIIYGLISMLLMQKYKHISVLIISFTLFIMTNNLISEERNIFNSIVLFLSPNLNEEASFISGTYYLVFLSVFYSLMNIIKYDNSDLVY